MCLQFGFVIFWQKNFGAKAAQKVLVKLTPGANVIKNTAVNYHGNFNPTNSRVKLLLPP